MNNLPNDLILIIGINCNLNTIINFSSINKNNFELFDDYFFKELAYKCYGYKFWEKAFQRPKDISLPLKKYKLELLRIDNFQKFLDSININRWTKKDFYNYWNYRDKYLSNEYLFKNLNFL
jgi:hypothetical protein